ncbi:dynein assembly factor 4, axonemal-like [Branchiostoma floridae]|uniref:Dynein axonemal assembly factor 4 n=1 Tax=Branchiostoma floridae TaxID=7739 RepID=A0A9J7HTQ4_BRAFL|nr:dynein assembly factor 4, axonemal-like [Branchiostoma floridae]
MPITVKDYTWEETETSVFITVPLKGVQARKTDIFSTDKYIKVNYPPYLFEVDLFAPVVDDKSTAQVGNGTVVFKLVKKDPGIWTQLAASDAGDKKAMIEKREKEIEKAQQRAEEQKKAAAERKRQEQKYALREQMRLEEEERRRVENAKKAEREQAMTELETWKQQQVQSEIIKRDENQVKPEKLERRNEVAKEEGQKLPVSAHTAQKIEPAKKKEQTAKSKLSMFDDDDANIPAIRSKGKIEVSFTPRVFPTPVRESKLHEEEEWLKKQTEAMRAAEIDDPNLSEEEKNPLWLKEKGDGFYKSGNVLAAVNAYSQAIRMDSKMPALYSNRAACHLQIRNFHKAAQDSSRALELLTPPVPANAAARCKAHVRRGTSLCQLEMYVEGLMDYEAALKIDPKNETLAQDAERIRQIIQGSTGKNDNDALESLD